MNLTEQQSLIAKKVEGRYLVLAGAGSGKTYTMTRRIITLIQKGFNSEGIIAISFTKKASNEIKERTLAVLPSAKGAKFGTFHSLCLKILKDYSSQLIELQLISDENFIILDDKDRTTLIKRFVNETQINMKKSELIRHVSNYMSRWARNLKFPTLDKRENSTVFEIWENIHQAKVKASYIDFDDILKYTLLLFKSYPQIKQSVSKDIHFLMIDEAQDLNDIQFRIAEDLSSWWGNIMVIGDDLQSIYKFRGAKVENFINMSSSDPSIETLKLTQNFRSSDIIVKASNDLISLNSNQVNKTSYSELQSKSLIEVNLYEDKWHEAEKITYMVQQDLLHEYRPENIAILFRNRNMIKEIEDSLISNKIPYYVAGSNKFFDLPMVQHLLKVARLIVYPRDELALQQCLLQLKGIDDQIIYDLVNISNHFQVSLARVIMSIEKWNWLTPEATHSLKLFWDKFYSNVMTFQEKLDNLETINDKINYCYKLTKQYPRKKSISDDETIDRLINLLKNLIITEEISQNASIFEVLNLINVSYEEIEAHDELGLLTIHSVKGLEFQKVYIVGLEEGNFPSFRAKGLEELEEERRLMYVAMTRAKEKLILNHVKRRYYNGNEYHCKPSRFINEIPIEFLQFK